MMRFAADENFNNDILRGVNRHYPDLDFDVVRIQDTAISGQDDLHILAWVHDQNRILLTHDIKTMPEERRGALELLTNSVGCLDKFIQQRSKMFAVARHKRQI